MSGNTIEITPTKFSSTFLEEVIRNLPKQNSLLEKIAKCESDQRQFNLDGSVLRGKVNNNDVGYMQINETYHLEASRKLGYDIYTLEGNKAYGEYLLETQGTKPWSASEYCWSK